MKKPKDKCISYRFMCDRVGGTGYHLDFETKDDALSYANTLSDPKIAWYGVYELDAARNTQITLLSNRIFETVIHIPKQSNSTEPKQHKHAKVK